MSNNRTNIQTQDSLALGIIEEPELITEPSNREPLAEQSIHAKKSTRWQKAVDNFGVAAEVSNAGIIIDVVGKWIPSLIAACAGIFSFIAFITDPLIYFFRSLIRITRIVGRNFFGITFEEEKNGTHKYQTIADIASLVLFSLAITLFLGLIIASPIGVTIAWVLALGGLSINGYFDYAYQAKQAKEKYDSLENDPTVSLSEKKNAKQEYISKRNSYRLFIALLAGLVFLSICGSAAVFAPPALVPILLITSKIASGYLGLIACGRFFNWMRSKKTEDEAEVRVDSDVEIEEAHDEPLSPSNSSTASLLANKALNDCSASLISDKATDASIQNLRRPSQSSFFASSESKNDDNVSLRVSSNQEIDKKTKLILGSVDNSVLRH